MERYLAMYDLSGIQDFIFGTNRLKEIVGASYLVSKALFANVPELLGEGPNDWKARDADNFKTLAESEGKTVYIGGGNALVLFGSKDRATSFARALKRKVFLQTGGALRICSAFIRVDDSTRLSSCLDPANPDGLRAKLDYSKSKAPLALTARGFSIDALDNDSYDPVLYFDKPLRDKGSSSKYQPRSSRLKLEAYATQGSLGQDGPTSPLVELMGSRAYEDDLDEFFKGPESLNQGKHFMAVIHIDGNTMGQRIVSFLKATEEAYDTLEEDLVAMRELSAFIGDSYKCALAKAIDVMYGPPTEEKLAFRPVVADGDDITFMCRSQKAFAFANAFVEALHEPAGNREGVAASDELPRPQDLSVGVGIALVRNGYPFSSAYAMAEELCKNAKKKALERFGAIDGRAVSSVDFHVCAGELVSNVADYRDRRMVQQRKDGSADLLCIRPYHMEDSSAVLESGLGFGAFLLQLGELQRRSKAELGQENPWIARSKLKGLRDKYGEGVSQAKLYGELIVERDMALRRTGSGLDAERAAFIKSFEDPFVELPGGKDGTLQHYAKFFDALDVMDLCEGTGELQ